MDRKIVLLEGRTDLFYIMRMYRLVERSDNVMYFPCGGASEIWPVVEAFKWKQNDIDIEFEVWVDNDYAGQEAREHIISRYPDVKIRLLGKHVMHGSIEDEVGFLSPKLYEKYKKLKEMDIKNHKKHRKQFKNIKHDLFADVCDYEVATDKQKKGINDFLVKFGILNEK